MWRHVKIHTQGGVQHTPTSDYFCLKLGIAPKLRDIKDASYFATSKKKKQTFEDISFAFEKKKKKISSAQALTSTALCALSLSALIHTHTRARAHARAPGAVESDVARRK